MKLTEQELKKLISNFTKLSRIDTKEEKCVLCGEELAKVCNSHSVPKFVLENMSDSGIVCKPYGFDEISKAILKQKLGLNEAGTFRAICLDCDSKWFSLYENESNLLNFTKLNKIEQTKILSQIYLKSSLLRKYAEKTNASLAEKSQNYYNNEHNMDYINLAPQVAKLNIDEYVEDIEDCIRYINDDYSKGFKLVYYKILDYVAPISFQSLVCLHTDLKGDVINDVFDYNPRTKMNLICLCSFPLKNKTVVMSFMLNKAWGKYRNFVKQFKNLKNSEKMLVLQNMVISHSEEIFIFPSLLDTMKIDNEIQKKFRLGLSDENLYRQTGLMTSLIINSKVFLKGTNYFSQKYEIKRNMNEK